MSEPDQPGASRPQKRAFALALACVLCALASLAALGEEGPGSPPLSGAPAPTPAVVAQTPGPPASGEIDAEAEPESAPAADPGGEDQPEASPDGPASAAPPAEEGAPAEAAEAKPAEEGLEAGLQEEIREIAEELPAGVSTSSLVIAVAFLLAVSGFFSSSETALFSLSPHQLRRMERPKASRGQRAAAALMKNSKNTLTTILIGNMMVNIATSLAVGALAARFSGGNEIVAFLLGTVVATLGLLIVGEILPKSVALEKAERYAPLVAPPLVQASRLFTPLRLMFLLAADAIFKILRLPPRGNDRVTEEEIKWLLSNHAQGVIERDGRDMISGVFDITDLTVDTIMTPRVNMQAYPDTLPREELEAEVRKEDSHSRVFIYHESIDRVIGVLHVKDLLLQPEREVRDLMREPVFAPPKKRAAKLLNDFRRQRQHIAVVIDEFGGTAGCVTMNDLMEEIVGDILQPGDADTATSIHRVGKRSYEIDGREKIDEVNERLGLNLPNEDAVTISGLVMNSLGEFARVGDQVDVDGARLRVTRMASRQISKVVLVKPAASSPEDSPSAEWAAAQTGTER